MKREEPVLTTLRRIRIAELQVLVSSSSIFSNKRARSHYILQARAEVVSCCSLSPIDGLVVDANRIRINI